MNLRIRPGPPDGYAESRAPASVTLSEVKGLFAALAVSVLALACGGGSKAPVSRVEGSIPTTRTARSASIDIAFPSRPLSAPEESRMQGLFDLISDTPENRAQLWVNDFAPIWSAWEAVGVSRPGLDETTTAMDQFLPEVVRASPFGDFFPRPRVSSPRLSGFDVYGALFSTYRFMGLDQRNVDFTALAGFHPRTMEIVIGQYDPERVEQRLARCFECETAQVEQYLDVEFYSWGADGQADLDKRFQPPAYDQVGHGGRIAVRGKHAFRTLQTALMHRLIEAERDRIPALGDDPAYRLMGRGIASIDGYAFLVSNRSHTVDSAVRTIVFQQPGTRATELEVRAALERGPLLEEFELAATGWGVAGQVPYAAIVLVHGDPVTAESNSRLLGDRLAEGRIPLRNTGWASLVSRAEV
ncbi:MAG: hypothetical protein HY678_00040, partial [Chloroflexi bacterium]|nr:hypothetical protein [Chloroflexota bacterium]